VIFIKRGFTLIELLVVIAIVGILSTVISMKYRESLANAKDSKATLYLASARGGVQAIYINKMAVNDNIGDIVITSGEIFNKVGSNGNQSSLEEEGGIEVIKTVIGGYRESENSSLNLGGRVTLTPPLIDNDTVILNFSEETYSTEGKKWSSY